MARRSQRRRRTINFVAAEIAADRNVGALIQPETLEERQLLSAITTEISDAPARIDDLHVIRDNAHDGTLTVAWNDATVIGQSAIDLPQFVEHVVEYEVRLTNEGVSVAPSAVTGSVLSGQVEFPITTGTHIRTILRRDGMPTTVEVSSGVFEEFQNATSYSLDSGIYSISVRYRFLPALLGDPFQVTEAPTNVLATNWSEWSESQPVFVIPAQQSYLIQAPEQIQKTGNILNSGNNRLAQQRHRLAWGFEEPTESFEVWITRRGEGRVFYDPAMTVNALDINSDFQAGTYRVWVKANPVDNNIATGWSPPIDFEIVDGGSAFLITETHSPNEPLRLHFGYTGVNTGNLQVSIFDENGSSDQPVIDVTLSSVITWTVDEDGLPAGNYRVVVQQLIGGQASGPARESTLRIEDVLTPVFRGDPNGPSYFSQGTAGQVSTLTWRSGSADAFDLWIAYDGPVNGVGTSSQRPQFQFVNARMTNTGSDETQYSIPASAPAGKYRVWIRGVRSVSGGARLTEWTDVVTFTLRPPALNVRVSEDAFRNTFATVDWDEIPDALSYSVEIRKSNAVFRHNGVASWGLTRKFDSERFSNIAFVEEATGWTIPFHMRPGHYVARVTALLDSGETVISEAFFSHRIAVISGISQENGVVTVNVQPEASAPQYMLFVSHLGDGTDDSNEKKSFYTHASESISPSIELPADAPVGTYRIWAQARIGAIDIGAWSEWSEPVDFVLADELTITSTAGIYTQLPPVTWDSTANEVRIVVRDSETDEFLRTETVRDANEWHFTDAEEGRSYRIVVTAISNGGVAGQQRTTWLLKRSQPVINFDQHLSKRVSWTWLNGIDRCDVWVAQDSFVDPATGENRPGDFRYVVQSRVFGNKIFLPEDAPNGSYRVWVRMRDASDQTAAWTNWFRFDIKDPPVDTVVHPPGVQQEVAHTIVDYLYSPIDRVSTLVPESIPDPDRPSVVSVNPSGTSSGPYQIEWQHSSVGETERFVSEDGVLVSARQIHEVEVFLEDAETYERLSFDGQPLPDQTSTAPSGRILVWDSENSVLPESLNLPAGSYSVSLRYRVLRVMEHDLSFNDKTVTGRDGVLQVAGRTLADNGLIRSVATDWSQFSQLYTFKTDATSAPVIRSSGPTIADFKWTAIPDATRYEVFLREESTGRTFRRFVKSPEFDGWSLNPDRGTTWRAWVRVVWPKGHRGLWSESHEYYLETLAESVQ